MTPVQDFPSQMFLTCKGEIRDQETKKKKNM